MIIDTHAQLFTKEAIESLPEEMARSYELMFRDMQYPDIEDTLKDMEDAGVDVSVIVAVDAETTFKYKVSNDLIAKTVNRYPDKLIGFASVDPHKGVMAGEELERSINQLGLKGLKVLPHLIKCNPNDPIMYPLYEIAQDAGIPVLFHTGTQFHAGTKIKYCMPLYLDEVAVDFPRMKIIMAHFGYPWFYEGMSIVLRNPNVYFNIAGWAPRRIPDHVIQQMNGPLAGKALFGSDYPLISRVRIMKELDALPLKDGVKDLLITENPKRVLGIG
ncbi:MAG TPA: amidohydrolase family protein [Syntrophales bacterium]|nr:amidohydrolase family protein [Syntrophales bacterium]